MIFFYIRHGDPIYDPDSPPLGERQAEAAAKRLALYGIDKVFASTSTRAIQTAKPTCEILKKEMTLLDFCNESHAWSDFTVDFEGGKTWIFQDKASRLLFTDKAVTELGYNWYEHPEFKKYNFKKGIERITSESDKLFLSLGYEHEVHSGKYRVINGNDERIALFAHQGFGLAFLSCLLDIPYPMFCNHFDMCHTGITVIDFREEDGYVIPKILTMSSDSHIYREGLPTNYNGFIRF